MATRSKPLYSNQAPAGGATLLFACPPSQVTLVKSILLYCPGPAASSVQVYVVNNTNGQTVTFIFETIAAAAHLEWNGWIVMDPTDDLSIYVATNPINVWVSGAQLPPRS